jgi:hypothetical protein
LQSRGPFSGALRAAFLLCLWLMPRCARASPPCVPGSRRMLMPQRRLPQVTLAFVHWQRRNEQIQPIALGCVFHAMQRPSART